MSSTVMVRDRKTSENRLRHMELALERERDHRINKERVLVDENQRLASENAQLRQLVSQLESKVLEQEKQLGDAYVASHEAKGAKYAFLSTLSHEFRTPLNAIIGYSELIREDLSDTDNEQLQSDITTIFETSQHLLALVNDSLDVVKLEAGKIQLSVTDIDIEALVNDLAHSVMPLMEVNDNHFVVSISPDVHGLQSDAFRLAQVLMKLLANAAKYTEKGQVDLNVKTSEENGSTICLFEIKDTGIGMTQSELERVFFEFEQADNSLSRCYQGAGLGLAIAQKLSQLIGGEISVISEKGKGSTFTLALPFSG